MALDFHLFFKYSAARREQYTKCHEITGVVAKMMEKHCESRWLSLEKVLVKISEQWDNIKQYFIKKIPTLPGFTGKKGVSSTARYGRIKSYLANKDIPVVMAFVVYFAQDFKKFIKSLETNEPMIQLLFPKCMQLMKNLFGKILKTEVFMKKNENDGGYVLKSINNIQDIDVRKESNHKTSCSFGTAVLEPGLKF